jgi:hypothetical protein
VHPHTDLTRPSRLQAILNNARRGGAAPRSRTLPREHRDRSPEGWVSPNNRVSQATVHPGIRSTLETAGCDDQLRHFSTTARRFRRSAALAGAAVGARGHSAQSRIATRSHMRCAKPHSCSSRSRTDPYASRSDRRLPADTAKARAEGVCVFPKGRGWCPECGWQPVLAVVAEPPLPPARRPAAGSKRAR